MTRVAHNVAANFAGRGWTLLLTLAVVPAYLHFLGVEAYGLIGLFISLAAIITLLDLGMSAALARELARRSVLPGDKLAMRDLLRTLETVYWGLGLVIGVLVVLLAPWIGSHWVRPQSLPAQTVEQTLMLMGIALACQWPRSLYAGGLAGLQRQVLLNGASSAMATLLNLGGVLILWQVERSLQALIAWHIAIALSESALLGVLLWRALPRALPEGERRARFDAALLGDVWRFAAGMAGIAAAAIVLTQLDKVILSKVLTLEAFGYYSLAWRVAGALLYVAQPVTAAFLPRFTQLAAVENGSGLAEAYHRSCQLLSVMMLPVAAVMVFFAPELLLVWTGDSDIASNAGPLLALLAAGAAANGLMNLPLAMQIAHGRTRAVLVSNLVAVAVLAPLIFYVSVRYGALGAAWVWLILNLGYVGVLLPIMHRSVLPGHSGPWLVQDVGAPLVAAAAVCALWWYGIGVQGGRGAMVGQLVLACVIATGAAAMAAPRVRAFIAGMGSWRSRRAES